MLPEQIIEVLRKTKPKIEDFENKDEFWGAISQWARIGGQLTSMVGLNNPEINQILFVISYAK